MPQDPDESESDSESSSGPPTPDPLDTAWELPACFLISGKPKRGKSHMIKALIYELVYSKEIADQSKFGMIYCSPSSMEEYDFITNQSSKVSAISGDQIEDHLRNYINNLLATKEKLAKQGKHLPANFIVFDDLVGVLNSNRGFFTQFITTHRKTNTTVFLATQYINKNISTTVRDCIGYSIMFNAKTAPSIRSLFNAFGGLFENEEDFKRQFFKQANHGDHSAMLYIETEEDLHHNYLRIRAPAVLPDLKIDFSKAKESGKGGKDRFGKII